MSKKTKKKVNVKLTLCKNKKLSTISKHDTNEKLIKSTTKCKKSSTKQNNIQQQPKIQDFNCNSNVYQSHQENLCLGILRLLNDVENAVDMAVNYSYTKKEMIFQNVKSIQ